MKWLRQIVDDVYRNKLFKFIFGYEHICNKYCIGSVNNNAHCVTGKIKWNGKHCEYYDDGF